MKNINVYSAGDYAGLEVDDLKFYYGYEVTEPEESDDWETEWCFQVKRDGVEVLKITTSQIEKATDVAGDEPVNYLLAGIAIWLNYEKQ